MKSLLLSAALAIGLVGSALLAQPAVAGLSSSGPHVVKIQNFAYSPASETIEVGQTVEWVNEDSAQHTATANDGTFKSPNLSQGHTFSHTFTKAGTYAYYCTFHRMMKGTIVVK
jgi:plastocyanin